MRNRVETRINAPREAVWRVIADFPRYPEWNPFTPQVIGRCAAGEKVRVFVQLAGEPFWMNRQVTKATENSHFEWVGRAWYSFLTPGQRALILQDDGPGRTLLIDDEYVGGFGFLMPERLRETLRQRMREFGAGLKTAVETAGHRKAS